MRQDSNRAAGSAKKYQRNECTIPWRYVLLLLILPVMGVGDLAVNHQSPWGVLVYVVASLLAYYFLLG